MPGYHVDVSFMLEQSKAQQIQKSCSLHPLSPPCNYRSIIFYFYFSEEFHLGWHLTQSMCHINLLLYLFLLVADAGTGAGRTEQTHWVSEAGWLAAVLLLLVLSSTALSPVTASLLSPRLLSLLWSPPIHFFFVHFQITKSTSYKLFSGMEPCCNQGTVYM